MFFLCDFFWIRFYRSPPQFLGVGKNFRLLMQSCRSCFFSPDLFMKISSFSKTVPTIFIKFCSHSTPKRAPTCWKASKSYDWNVRNIAKISPKISSIFSKTLHTIRTKFSTVILPILKTYMCNGIKIVWLGCEKQPKLTQIWPKNSHFLTFIDFLKISMRFERNFLVILHHDMVLCVQFQ